eukprot:5012887-Pyramimonas_sp.AAC.1
MHCGAQGVLKQQLWCTGAVVCTNSVMYKGVVVHTAVLVCTVAVVRTHASSAVVLAHKRHCGVQSP